MKLHLTIFGDVLGAALMVLATTQGVVAQISNEYTISVQPRVYSPQSGQGVEITRSQFLDPVTGVVDADNGVAGPIDLGFLFQYNNQLYTQIYISVNGWISFQNPASNPTNDPLSLFNGAPPNLTVAPFFGDHYLRKAIYDGLDPSSRPYTPSTIRVVKKNDGALTPDTVIVEWEDLNINYSFDYADPDNPNPNVANVQPQATSVATFQLYLFQADADDPSQQGRMEFHYGPVGSATAPGVIKLSGGSVGIEDEPVTLGGPTTFINGVAYRESGNDINTAITSTLLSKVWPPTGFPGQCFVFQCAQCNILNSTLSRITGTVFRDDDGDCQQNGGEPGLSGRIVEIVAGSIYATTDLNGDYSQFVVPGSYSVTAVPYLTWINTCPTNVPIVATLATPGLTSSGNNLAVAPPIPSTVSEPGAIVTSVRSYPRPALDEVYIDGVLVAGSPMTLRSIDGATVRKAIATGRGREEFRVAGLPSGVYLLEMETKRGRAIERVVIAR